MSHLPGPKGDLPMKPPKNIDVLFVAGFGPVVRDPAASRKFYSEALGLSFKEDATGYLNTSGLEGVKHFALWPLAQAAESCFGCGSELLPPLRPGDLTPQRATREWEWWTISPRG